MLVAIPLNLVGGNSIEFGLCYGGHIFLISGCHKAKEPDAFFLGDNCGINDGFHSRDDHNFYKKLSSILLKVKFNTTALHYAPMSWAMINFFGAIHVINGQYALAYWVSGQFLIRRCHFTTPPCEQSVFKEREMLGI